MKNDTAIFDAEFSDKAEFLNEQNEMQKAFNAFPGMKEMLTAKQENDAAAEYNRESKFQHGNETLTVSLKWNKASYGYEVTLHSSTDNKTTLVTKACGYIRASKKYREYCKLTFETVFGS